MKQVVKNQICTRLRCFFLDELSINSQYHSIPSIFVKVSVGEDYVSPFTQRKNNVIFERFFSVLLATSQLQGELLEAIFKKKKVVLGGGNSNHFSIFTPYRFGK